MIALDAMGGDFAPTVTVQGAIQAARKGIAVGLYGDEIQLRSLLDKADEAWSSYPISLFHCSQVIGMGEEPSRTIIKKNDSSLVRALRAINEDNATAVVTAGNTGAALVGGTLILGRASGILRPALGNFLPTPHGGSLFCLDLGANVDCKPEFLAQFALMGHAYVSKVKGIAKPRVALLSNGSEPYKGNEAVKQAYDQLMHLPINFIGNIEARDIFDGGVDVLVSDGFAGNVMLKAVQGTAKAMGAWIKAEAQQLPWYRKLGFALGKPVFNRLKGITSYADKPGALLLGLKHPLIVAHGCAQAAGVERAIIMAHELVQEQFVPTFNEQFLGLSSMVQPSTFNYQVQSERNDEKSL